MGDDAVFHAFRGQEFSAAWTDRAEKGRARLDALLEACKRECLLEELQAGWDLGSDLADTSLDDRLEGEQLEAWLALKDALLAADACPWFARRCDARDAQGGALAPQVLAGLVARLRETGALAALGAALEADDMPNGFAELSGFLERAADAGAWVLWSSC